MKLLVISAAFPPMRVGEADHALQLCWRIAERGFDVHILTTKGSAQTGAAPFTVHPIMSDWSWFDLPRLVRFLSRCSPDVIVLIYIGLVYNEHPMITFAPTISKLVLPSARFITQFENIYGSDPGSTSIGARMIRKFLALWLGYKRADYCLGTLLHDSDRIITLSNQHLAELSEHEAGLKDKSLVIPAPPLLRDGQGNADMLRERGRRLLGVQPHDFVIVYFGRIYPDKGIDTLLRAFQRVASHRHNIHLVLVGGVIDGPYPTWTSFAHDISQLPTDLGIADKVTWSGEYAWDSDVPSVYLRASDICVLPYTVGIQLNNSSFAAAASLGLPIVTTRSETIDSHFVHEENVYLCPPRNPAALASALESVLDRPDLRARLRSGALKLAHEWFSWERVVERTLSAFPLS